MKNQAAPRTEDVIAAYRKDVQNKGQISNINRIDCSELYSYEGELGKSIFEMTSDELTQMISEIYVGRATQYAIQTVISTLRNLFNFYINNYNVIINPFVAEEWRGVQVVNRILSLRTDKTVTKEKFEKMISDIRNYFEGEQKNYCYADYFECILRLAYDGFIYAKEYVQFSEDDVDFEKKTIRLEDRTIRMSDRSAELLLKIHENEYEIISLPFMQLTSYNGSYFKCLCRKVRAQEFNSYSIDDVSRGIMNKLNSARRKCETPYRYNFRELCLLGFYDHLVSKYSKDEILTMIQSGKDKNVGQILRKETEEYELPFPSAIIKSELVHYI